MRIKSGSSPIALVWSRHRDSARPARVAFYARVSTIEQAAGYSLDEQATRLRAFCDGRGGQCVRVFREVESGGTMERPKLERLLRLAEADAFDIVLVWRVDRLGRSNLDLQNLWAFFKALGIDVVSATEPFDSTTVQGKLLFDMNAMLAEWERGTIRERASMGLLGRAKEGKWHGGPPAHGYAYDRSTGRLVVDAVEADLVRHIANTAWEVRELSATVRVLGREGCTTRHGKAWSKPTVSRLLGNPVYVGILRFRDLVTRDESLRILDDGTWARLQALRVEWRRHRIAQHHRPRDSRVRDEWCIRCGYALAGARAYCSNCGVPQWIPADEDAEPGPTPAAAEQAEGHAVR